ncbi:RING-type domain-containing protein [Mycena chlorophos]|uniref:RING-type domain-containing protein n=1 Tax=Mycena chlorophos TaxID=658473 RepID=A0A8H6TA98_MYCCL|nr:RING-type domain-containing protein [Mycena chlorophos]
MASDLDLDALLRTNDSHQLRERVSALVSDLLAHADDPSGNQLSHEQRTKLIEDLPRLTESQIHDAGHDESLCAICFTPFGALLAEEETALAMDSPAYPIDELGVTKLGASWQCGHFFCRKDISKWIRSGHASCPMCRRSLAEASDGQPASNRSEEDTALLEQIQTFMQQMHSSGSVAYVDHDGEFRGFGDALYVPAGGYNDEDRSEFSGMYS